VKLAFAIEDFKSIKILLNGSEFHNRFTVKS